MMVGGPGPMSPEEDGAGIEVHDGMQAATAVLEGESLVILRSATAEAQAGKVNALRAALYGRPIRVLRLDGKHPRGLASIATPEPEADRAVLVVEHADTLDPATLDALRDVENLQLVLFHRTRAFAPAEQGALTDPLPDRFPPGSLIAFDLDPKREHWGMLLAAVLLAAVSGVVLLAVVSYYDLSWRFWDTATSPATANRVAAPSQLATASPVTNPPPIAERTISPELGSTEPGPEPGPAIQPPQTTAATGPQTTAAASPQPAPATDPDTAAGVHGTGAIPFANDTGASQPTPLPGRNSSEQAFAPIPLPPLAAESAIPPSGSRTHRHSGRRAELQRDFDEFLAGAHGLPKHLNHAQRRALFNKFLVWRARQEAQASR